MITGSSQLLQHWTYRQDICNKSPGGHDAHLRSLKSHLSQVVCGKPMGYIINSNNLEDLHVMMFERYKVFTIGSRGGGGGGG